MKRLFFILLFFTLFFGCSSLSGPKKEVKEKPLNKNMPELIPRKIDIHKLPIAIDHLLRNEK